MKRKWKWIDLNIWQHYIYDIKKNQSALETTIRVFEIEIQDEHRKNTKAQH